MSAPSDFPLDPLLVLRDQFSAAADMALFEVVHTHLLGRAETQRCFQGGLARIRLAYLEAFAAASIPLTPSEAGRFELAQRLVADAGGWLPEQAIADARALGRVDGLRAHYTI